MKTSTPNAIANALAVMTITKRGPIAEKACPINRGISIDPALAPTINHQQKFLFWDFSMQPLCPLCLGGVALLGIHQPQRHRGHRGCTEKSQKKNFLCKALADLNCVGA